MIHLTLVHRDDTPEAQARLTRIRDAIAAEPGFKLINDVSTGEQGLAAIKSRTSSNPRILLLQFHLPDMTGFQFMTHLDPREDDLYIIPVLEGHEEESFLHSLRELELDLDQQLQGPLTDSRIRQVLLNAAPKAEQLRDLFGSVVIEPAVMEPVLVPEIIESNLTSETVQPVKQAAPKLQPINPGRHARVVTVIGARGGVGKSLVAVNLAVSLAKRGDRVLLLDMSGTPGDLVVYLDDVPLHNMKDALALGADHLTEGTLSHIVARHEKLGFSYLAAHNQELDYVELDYNFGRKLIAAASGLADYVIIDTGLPRAIPTRVATDWANLVLCVTTRDVTRLLASKNYLKELTSEKTSPPAKFKVVINFAEAGEEIAESEIEELLEHPVNAFLPCAIGPVFFSINTGSPIVTTEPRQPLSEALTKLAAQIKTWTK